MRGEFHDINIPMVQRLVLAIVLGYGALAHAQNWNTLFDGKTFKGWEPPRGGAFSIEDGCLRPNPKPQFEEDLFTTARWADFELEFDWKISPRGNSGVKYRIQDRIILLDEKLPKIENQVHAAIKNRRTDVPAKGVEYVIGFEYQITDNATNPDASRNGPTHQTAALYDMFAATKDASKPVGEFNHGKIVVKGDHFEHWLNGEKITEGSLKAPEIANGVGKRWGEGSAVYDLLVKQPRRECQISLQNHNDPAWFKNIRIRKL